MMLIIYIIIAILKDTDRAIRYYMLGIIYFMLGFLI